MNICGKKILKDYYSAIYRLIGVNIDFVAPGGKVFQLCEHRNINGFCKLINSSDMGKQACLDCDAVAIKKAMAERKSIIYKCHARIEALMELISLIGNYIVESENKIFFLSQINERDKISSARQFVEKKYQQKITVSDVASHVYLSPSHFSHLFKKETGLSLVQYLNTYRMEKAEELLANTDLDISEIAVKVGFQSIPHFNRIFRKISKTSPREYRNSKERVS